LRRSAPRITRSCAHHLRKSGRTDGSRTSSPRKVSPAP
jgi:hypothetical protein